MSPDVVELVLGIIKKKTQFGSTLVVAIFN